MDHSDLRQGPTDHRLLVLQRQHRSHAVWEANGKRPDDCATLVVHRSEQNLRKLPPLSQPVIELISQAGFGALLDMPFMRLDLGLLTALVERWRPETHTFHFPSGEATVTLQDVEVLTGLPINGKPVIGKTDLPWGQLVEQLLGRKLPEEMRRGNKVSMAWLRQHFPGRVLDGATQAQIEQQARGYILHLIGGILAPDTTSYVHLCYLKLLEDLEVAGQYSWGSACLASLYRYLCHVSEAKNHDVGGMFVLLQVWAWERLPYLAPGRLGERPPRDGAALIGRWDDDFHSPDLATHVVGHYRHALDMQRPDEVVWQPYSEELIESLPPFCRAGRAIWRAKVPLINFATVEMHQPERVMRQFGFRQLVPPQSQARNALHGRTLKKGPQDWEVTNGAAVALWNNRLQLVEPEGIPDLLHVYPAGDDYVVWYESITVRYVSQMSAAMDKATRLFRSLIRPDLPEEAQAIGKQGLVCMAAQEKFLRKEPPVHLVFKPEEGNEEGGEDQANFEPAVEGPILQQKAHAHEEEVVYELQAQPQAEARAQDSPLPVQGGVPSTEAEASPTSVSTSYASPLQIQNPCGSSLGPFSKSHMFTHDVTGSSLQPGSPSETPADTVKANIIVLPVSGADSTLDDRLVVKRRSVETTIDDLVTTHHTSMPESTPPHPTIVSHVSYEVEDAMVEDEVLTRVQGDRGIGGEGVGEGEDHGQREIFLDAPVGRDNGRDNLEVEGRDNREVEGDQVGEEGVGHVTWDRERELGGGGVTTVWNVSHHISWPSDSILTQSWVISLLNAFDWGSKYLAPSEFSLLLPIHVFDNLVTSASKILRKEPNCITIDGLGANSSVVVVGDIHGQLHDLIFLLLDAGFLEDDKVFVFNGDYVDRGAWGLETFLLLLAWKVSMPDKVYLLRGNHESKKCTSVYGFKKEVLTKYGDKGNQVYEKCIGCFKELPLASIIAGCVYTTHGGLFRCVATATSKRSKRRKTHKAEASSLALGSLEDLSKARRAVLDPQWKGSNLVLGDVLWSDPSMSLGLSSNEERGIGLLWGPDCTEEFLKKSNLKLIIRSHEGPDAREKRPGLGGMEEGYTIDHVVESGKLITLFSAPDYPQFQATEERYKNKGAYIVLVPPHFDSPVFHSFEAVTPRPKANPYYDYEDVIDSGEELDFESMG